MSRAYRPADFEAFLRKHSDSSPSQQSEQPDRAQMDRGSRASSHGDRQSRDQRDSNRDNSDRFRTMYHQRNREYSLRESEVRTLVELGKFRVVPTDDLARLGYRGDRSQMENDVQHLRHQGLVEQRSIEGHESHPDGSIGRKRCAEVLGAVAEVGSRSRAMDALSKRLNPINSGSYRPQSKRCYADFIAQDWIPVVLRIGYRWCCPL